MTPDDLCSEWPVKSLEDVVDILDRHRVPVNAKERAKRSGHVPYYGAAGQVGTIDNHIFNEPLVLLGEDGIQFTDPGATKAYLIDGPSWVNNHAHVLRATAGLDRRFLMHWLNTCDYGGLVNGTTRLKLTQKSMRGMPVPIPPISKQRSVVEVVERLLSQADAARRTVVGGQSKLKRLRAGLYARFFSHASSINGLTELGGLLDRIEAGKSFKCPGHPAGPGMPGVLKLGAVTWGDFDPSENKEIPAHLTPDPRWEVRPGDLLIGRANTAELVGATALVRETPPGLYLSDKTLRLVPADGVSAEWIKAVLAAPQARAAMSAVATGTSDSMRNISQAKIRAVQVPAPPPDAPERLAGLYRQLSQVRHLEPALVAADSRARALRRATLNAAFTGRLSATGGSARSYHGVEKVVA